MFWYGEDVIFSWIGEMTLSREEGKNVDVSLDSDFVWMRWGFCVWGSFGLVGWLKTKRSVRRVRRPFFAPEFRQHATNNRQSRNRLFNNKQNLSAAMFGQGIYIHEAVAYALALIDQPRVRVSSYFWYDWGKIRNWPQSLRRCQCRVLETNLSLIMRRITSNTHSVDYIAHGSLADSQNLDWFQLD